MILSWSTTGQGTSIWIEARLRVFAIVTAASVPTESCYSKRHRTKPTFGCATLMRTEEKQRCAATAPAALRVLQITLPEHRQKFLLKRRRASLRRSGRGGFWRRRVTKPPHFG